MAALWQTTEGNGEARNASKALKRYADGVARTNLFLYEKHQKNFSASRLKGQNTCARARGTSEQKRRSLHDKAKTVTFGFSKIL